MKSKLLLVCLILVSNAPLKAQLNIISTSAIAEQVMLGNYDPATYQATTILNLPGTISSGVNASVSPDSLHAYLDVLRSFQTRNTGSDTLSNTRGIGAARRWIYSKFQQFSNANENRLVPSYLQFDEGICSVGQHRNIFAVLPGMDTTDKSIIIIEAHMDTRCAVLCDTACLAEGMEDNGSGTALVIELARIMSKYSYNHTIVFLLTMAEEQGLNGATAFATYATQKSIKIKSVLNNDVIGGVFCGHTSSPPSCPGFADIDSTQVRLFSLGSFNSPHKQLSRYIKLQYKELLLPMVSVPMAVTIMTDEDRTGRGGDHIPFRQKGFAAMRFTAANENGNANAADTSYHDRQHTSDDILGIDKDMNGSLDSFFVDFNYLARNTVINGNAAGMIGISPNTPQFTLNTGMTDITVNITTQQQYLNYRVAVRSLSNNDWDSLYTFTGTTSTTIPLSAAHYAISVASVDDKGVESLFSEEKLSYVGVKEIQNASAPVELIQNKPNPADEATTISVLVNEEFSHKDAYISIRDMAGKEIKKLALNLTKGMNEIIYEHGYNMSGMYIYTLVIDGKQIASKRMIFTN